MEIKENIVNRVAASGLITVKLSDIYPQGERVLYDIKQNLFQGLMLREKDFRTFIKDHDFSQYKDKYVAITCSADAIVPLWAYMLLASEMQAFAKKIIYGSLEELNALLFHEALAQLDVEQYTDQRIVIKGCSDVNVPISAYVELTTRLRFVAKSIMFGEPCSTVPVFKRKK